MNDDAYEIIWNGHRLKGWLAFIVMSLLGVLPWSVGVIVIISAIIGNVKVTW